jgi:hypothetical protein
MLEPRGLSREAAAAYVGLSLSSFDTARRAGEYPRATLPGKRFDRILIDKAADKLSGVKESAPDPLDEWIAKRAAREKAEAAAPAATIASGKPGRRQRYPPNVIQKD